MSDPTVISNLTPGILSVFNFRHSSRRKILFLYGLNLHFSCIFICLIVCVLIDV